MLRLARPHSKQKHFEIVDVAVKYRPGQYLAENPEIAEALAAATRRHSTSPASNLNPLPSRSTANDE